MPHSLNVILAAAAANGAAARRDRRRLVVLFLLPATVMAVVGLAMSGYSSASFVVGVLDNAQTSASQVLVARLADKEQFRIRRYTNQEKLRLAVFRGRINAGILIPHGWNGESNLPTYLSSASAGSAIVGAGINAELSRMATGGKRREVPIRYPAGGRVGLPRLGFAYTAPANLVLFVMINGFVSALGILRLRDRGIARRLLATPRRTWELFGMLAVGPAQQMIAQALFLILSARLFFGVHWGNPLGLIFITAALTCLGVAIVLFMGTMFTTEQQATSLGPWIGVFFGMLGGCMWPLEIVPPFMKTLALLSPANWAMDAYLGLIFDRASASEVAPDVGMVFAFAAVIAMLGIIRLRPQLSR